MGKALETEDNRVDRIKEALATINLYLDEEYDFDKKRRCASRAIRNS